MKIDKIDIRDGEYGASRVYIFPSGESVFENFGNRAGRPHELYAQHVMPAVLKAMDLPANTRFGWSIHAGCRMCPCSPGFVLSPPERGREVYVTVSGDDAKIEDTDDARAERDDRLIQLGSQPGMASPPARK